MLSPAQMDALMLDVHRGIEDAARHATNALVADAKVPRLSYPPNGGLSDQERVALTGLADTPVTVSGLRKLIADAIAGSFFTFFNLLDGTGDPMHLHGDDWPGFELVEAENGGQMLHEYFFETYWAWRDRRPDPGWRLDNLEPDPG